MSLHEPHHERTTDHLQRLLDRLHREATKGSSIARSFVAVCNVTSIPHDLRAQLLRDLVRQGYVTQEGQDQIRLTTRGTQLVTSPAAQATGRRTTGKPS